MIFIHILSLKSVKSINEESLNFIETWEIIEEDLQAVNDIYESSSTTAFSRVVFSIAMRRKPSFYVMTIIIPTAFLGVITLFTYFVPVHYVDRSVQSVTVLLAIAVFEVMIAENLPKTTSRCMLTTYLTMILATSALTIFISAVCLAIVDPGEYIDALWGIPNLAKALFFWTKKVIPRRGPTTATSENKGKKDQNDADSKDEQWSLYESIDLQQMPGVQNRQKGTRKHADVVPHHKVEPERQLTTSKTAWYIAYAVNWIAFSLCFIITVIVPIIAFSAVPSNFNISKNLTLSDSYYGD